MPSLPDYLIKRTPKYRNQQKIRELLSDSTIHTVCESAFCPNLGECFANQTLTFMILGNICTRSCAFCGISKGFSTPVDVDEPKKIADAVKKLNLHFVVVTSVTRDDLPDGGAGQFAEVINLLKPIPVEVLIPDLLGNIESLKIVLDAGPVVLNHNIETIERLYSVIRPQAEYSRSLELLRRAKEMAPHIYTKSGFMVGLGETDDEIIRALSDLKSVGCNIVTIGQYLPPSKQHPKVDRYVDPTTFEHYKKAGEDLGFLKVFSGPFVRSSYKAEEILCCQNNLKDS